MNRCCQVLFVACALATIAAANDNAGEPVLRIDAGGPTTVVSSLAWSGNGQTLFHAGYDKVIHVWGRGTGGKFALEANATYRVPLGPGQTGAINAIAVSHDGKLLAIGAVNPFRRQAGFRGVGFVAPVSAMPEDMKFDRGAIQIVDTQTRLVRWLRGHRDAIQALAFAPHANGRPNALVSAAFESNADGKDFGIVKIWDADAGKVLTEQRLPKTIGSAQIPTLAVRRHPERGTVEVAVAGIDNGVVLFAEDAAPFKFQFGPAVCNGAIAFAPGENALVAGFNNLFGKWPLDGLRRGDLNVAAGYQFNDGSMPLWVGYVAGDNPAIACLTYLADASSLYRLTLHSPADFKPQEQPLAQWANLGRRPIVALSPTTSQLATVGGSSDAVVILNSKIPNPPNDKAQRLAGVAADVGSARFVSKGERIGLKLAVGGGPPFVLDVAGRQITADANGWDDDIGSAEGWRLATAIAGQKTRCQLIGPDRKTIDIGIDGLDSEPKSWAISANGGTRLAAIAFMQLSDPVLGLFDLDTGSMVRQLTGHSRVAGSLAFSKNGKLLASVGGDRVVCIWSLHDLDLKSGRNGKPLGVQVKTENGRVVVAAVDPKVGRFAPGELQVGDVIESLVDGEESVQPSDAAQFHDTFYLAKVGGKVIATRRREGVAAAQVGIAVGQGADDVKPLASLLFAADNPQNPGWIAWSPMGPYDCSDPAIEARLGWHYNTGNAASPTAYASVEQLRRDFYRPGILGRLIAEGRWRYEFAAPPAPPAISLSVEMPDGQREPLDGAQWPLLRSATGTLRLALGEFPVDHIDKVRIGLHATQSGRTGARPQDGLLIDMTPAEALEWTASLGDLLRATSARRGMHLVAATVTTNESPPREFVATGNFELYPLAPKLEVEGAGSSIVVEVAEFAPTIRIGQLDPTVQTAEIELEQRVAGNPAAPGSTKQRHVWQAKEKEPWRPKLQLTPGANAIIVRAVNADSPGRNRELETTTLELAVVYDRKPQKPPRFANFVVRAANAAARESTSALPQGAGSGVAEPPTWSTSSRALVRARVDANEALAEVRLKVGDRAEVAIALPAGPARHADISQSITLDPGRQTVALRARSVNSDWSEISTTAEYRPPTPVATMVFPTDGQTFVAGRDSMRIAAKARFEPNVQGETGWAPFEAKLLLDGVESAIPVAIDANAGQLVAELELDPKTRSLAFRTTNRWSSSSISAAADIRVLRPPKLLGVRRRAADAADRPPLAAVDLVADAASDLPILEVRVNDRPMRFAANPPAGGRPVAAGKFELLVPGLPLVDGENRFAVAVGNADGMSATQQLTLAYAKPVELPPPPVIEILQPGVERTTTAATLEVLFRVRSAGPLRQVELLHETAKGKQLVPVVRVPARQELAGFDEYRAQVALAADSNAFTVSAQNAGGQSRSAATVTKIATPPRFVVKRLVTLGQSTGPLDVPFTRENNRLAFAEPAPQARVRLHAALEWTDSQSDQGSLVAPRRDAQIDVWVNGMRQLPASAAVPRQSANGAVERPFAVDLVLDRKQGNRVRLAPVGFAVDAASQSEWSIDCAAPATSRNVYVLGIAPFAHASRGREPPVGPDLADRLKKAIDFRPGNPPTCAFGVHKMTLDLVGGKATCRAIQGAMLQIRSRLLQERDASALVLVYYEGQVAKPAGAGLDGASPATRRDQTSADRVGFRLPAWESIVNPNLDQNSISDRDLAQYFAKFPGAQVLLMEVATVPPGRQQGHASQPPPQRLDEDWPRASDVAMFRLTHDPATQLTSSARLLAGLAAALPGLERFGQLDQRISSKLEQAMPVAFRQIRYDPYIPPELGQLAIAPSETAGRK